MAATTVSFTRRVHLGPVVVQMTRVTSAGTADTVQTPILAQSATNHRAFAIINSPLNDGASTSSIIQTTPVGGMLVLSVNSGASPDVSSLKLFTW